MTRPRFNEAMTVLAAKCKTCGGPTKSADKSYCSAYCVGKARGGWNKKEGTWVIRNCATCGKEFRVQSWYFNKGHGQGRFCSRSCFGGFQATSLQKFSRGVSGRRTDLGNRYFRSRWEANWARYLEWMKARGEIREWDYEAETFEFHGIKRGSRFYTPDFKVINLNGKIEYHEVKGWMDQKSATKLKRMAKYYPDHFILLVDRQRYKQVRSSIGPLIEKWEQEDEHFAKLR